MSNIKELLIDEFINQQIQALEEIEERLRVDPLTYQQKINILKSILLNGVRFGIEKGIFIEQARQEKISRAKRKRIERMIDELFYTLNDDIIQYRNQPKVKYSKRKYRARKKTRQLSLLKELGFNTDLI